MRRRQHARLSNGDSGQTAAYLYGEGFAGKSTRLAIRAQVGQEPAVRAGDALAAVRLGHLQERVGQLHKSVQAVAWSGQLGANLGSSMVNLDDLLTSQVGIERSAVS